MKRANLYILVLTSLYFTCSNATAKNLEDFNHSPTAYYGLGDISTDPDLLETFKDKKIVCGGDEHFTPHEKEAAVTAFKHLADYVSTGDQTPDFWYDTDHQKKRLNLLTTAVKEGSWKANYIDSLWEIKSNVRPDKTQTAAGELRKLTQQGIPIVIYKYATFFYGRDYKTMYTLLSEAVDRGNPQAMAYVGGDIVAHSKDLLPIGKELLECAVKQGYAPAYNNLGKLAFMEGRRLDAYRLWEKGLNEGCAECSENLMPIARIRPGYNAATTPMKDLMPELVAISEFYDNNFFYVLSELPELKRPLPNNLAFHPSKEELLKLLESQQQ
jgi:hypothetical protein